MSGEMSPDEQFELFGEDAMVELIDPISTDALRAKGFDCDPRLWAARVAQAKNDVARMTEMACAMALAFDAGRAVR